MLLGTIFFFSIGRCPSHFNKMKPLNFIYHNVKRQKLHIKHNSHVDKKQSSEGLKQNTSWLNCLVHWTDSTKEIFSIFAHVFTP